MAIPATTFLLFQINKVQTYIAQQVVEQLATTLQTEVKVEKVKIRFINLFQLKNVFIRDLNKDTLLHANAINVNIRRYNLEKKQLYFNQVKFDEATINFYTDSLDGINFQFIVDAIKQNSKKDTSNKKSLDIFIRKINFKDSRFKFHSFRAPDPIAGKVNFSDMDFSDLNIQLNDFDINSDTINFHIKQLAFIDKSGFQVNWLAGKFSLCKRHIMLDEAYIRSAQTKIYANRLKLSFDDFQQFSEGRMFGNVNMYYDIDKAYGHTDNIGYIVPVFYNLDSYFSLKGLVYGTLDNLKASDLSLEYSENTKFDGNFSITGLPDIEQTYMYYKIKNLTTISSELKSIINGFSQKNISIPVLTDELGLISYRGNYSGFANDFVAYGRLNTAMGELLSDVSLQPDSLANIKFKGAISSNNFEPRILFKDDIVGNIAFETRTEGIIDKNSRVNVRINGLVHSLVFNNYNYKNISLKGDLQNDKFDGDIVIDDPNLELDFSGKVDFSDEKAIFDFYANVNKANLYKLNIDKKDNQSQVTFVVNANGEGSNLNEFRGEISIVNSFFIKTNKQLQLYNFNLTAERSKAISTLKLNSDFIDGELSGDYDFATLGNSFTRLIHKVIPALNPDSTVNFGIDENNFKYSVNLKHTSEITHYFFPGLQIANNSTFSGEYSPDKNYFQTTLESGNIGINNISIGDVIFNSSIEDSLLNLSTLSKELKISDNISLHNFAIELGGANDSLILKSFWNNKGSKLYKGQIFTNIIFDEQERQLLPKVTFNIKPSDLAVNDTLWSITKSSITIDTNGISIKDFEISHREQKIALDGSLSYNTEEQLTLTSENFSLQNINALIKSNKLEIKGSLNGKAVLSDIFNNPLFLSDLNIDEFEVNGYSLGETNLTSEWDNEDEKLMMSLVSKRGFLKTLSFNTDYYPSNQAISSKLELNKFRLDVFNPFFNGIFSEINGICSGELILSGTLQEPVANGEVQLNKSSFVIDYLNTRYNFSDKVSISNNNILFSNIEMYDQFGNNSKINGSIQNRYFKNLNFNLNIEANNFLFLNTTYENNTDFYGKAFASGVIKITGPPDNIDLNVVAKTNSNTVLYIPLNTTENVGQYNFLKFTDTNIENLNSNDYNVNLKGLQMRFDLEVTPDAEAQIIFDSKVGDILKGRGAGNIVLEINTLGKFNMYGDYFIDGGDYLFTLGNIINKRFSIEKGGSISWNGDPLDADIDLNAVYTTKVSGESLQELQTSEKRIPVNCHLYLSDKLLNPSIRFGISTPATEPEIRTAVQDIASNEAELDKQFLFLLVVNSFMVSESGEATLQSGGSVTTFEMLSNQLSHYLSQWSEDFDIGVNYRPGSNDKLTSQELEVALSTKILNDRVSIRGNLDMSGNAESDVTENSSNIVGEFDLDVKLSKSDKLHLKAYNKAHENIERNSEYRYGVGVSYKEEFDTWPALLKRYFTFSKDSVQYNN